MIESLNPLVDAAFAGAQSSINTAAPAGMMLLGLLTGLRHSLEADHMAAVSTIVADNNKKFHRAPLLGTLWGLGHTASLFAAGLAVLLLAVNMPDRLAGTLEFGVGVMLVFLGATALTGFSTGKFFRGTLGRTHAHAHVHQETGIVHSHKHAHEEGHRHGHKSVIVGMVHGLAGSGALMLAVLSTAADSVPLGLAYIALFGAGSVAGMAALSALVGLSFAKASVRTAAILRCTAAIATLAIGAGLMWQLAGEQFWQ